MAAALLLLWCCSCSVRAPRAGGRDRAPEPYGLDAREFLRKKLIGKDVTVKMEYTRKVGPQVPGADGAAAAAPAADVSAADTAGAVLGVVLCSCRPCMTVAAYQRCIAACCAELHHMLLSEHRCLCHDCGNRQGDCNRHAAFLTLCTSGV